MMFKMNASTSSTPASSSLGGKIVVIGIFVVALLAASAGLSFKYFASQQPLELWGAEGVQVIQKAGQVELLTLSTADEKVTGLPLKFGGASLGILATQDISRAPGLIHHRHFLTERVSYESAPTAAKELRSWTHALKFQDGTREVVVLFALADRRLGNLQTGREVQVIPEIAENWQRFLNRQLNGETKE
jgi:hypothetical protein